MKTLSKLFIISAMLLLSFSATSAQNGPWQVILYSGDTLTACRLDSLHDNFLIVTCDSSTLSFPVDFIVALVKYKEGHFWKGAAIGIGVGVMTGIIIGVSNYKEPEPKPGPDFYSGPNLNAVIAAIGGGLMGAVGGFVIGGSIGALSSVSETYDLRGMKLKVKCYVIEQLLSK